VAGVEVRAVDRPPITRRELGWGAFFFGAIALLFAVSIVIGVALTKLPFVWGGFVAFVLVVLVAALLAPEVRTFWSKLPR
jgi:hypothetical protein